MDGLAEIEAKSGDPLGREGLEAPASKFADMPFADRVKSAAAGVSRLAREDHLAPPADSRGARSR